MAYFIIAEDFIILAGLCFKFVVLNEALIKKIENAKNIHLS